jgi:alpha-tubulin suppressor-like RCC1 family protein
MFTRTTLFRTRVVASVFLLGGTMALGLACGTRSHTTAQVVGLRSAAATAISAGSNHTCALLSNHKVECWGSNRYGQLGDGVKSHGRKDAQGFDFSPNPVLVSVVTNATAISAGGGHTCALLSNHRVKCWGYNDDGELGNGKTTNSSTPVPVSAVTNATAISAGEYHTCVLLSNHSVECWGYNDYLQLGDGRTTNSSTPVLVSGVTNATAISAGAGHTCALLSNHRVECWGDNYDSKLGNGKTKNSSTPVPVSSVTNATAISAGNDLTCALLSNHKIKCWGGNGYGQLGDGVKSHGHRDAEGFDFSPTPVPVSSVTNATAISAGNDLTCALLSNHRVKCWGENYEGELGNGSTTNSSTPVTVSAVTNATAISAGVNTCALLSNHTVECWGVNGAGQLGNGETTNSSTPVSVVGLS